MHSSVIKQALTAVFWTKTGQKKNVEKSAVLKPENSAYDQVIKRFSLL